MKKLFLSIVALAAVFGATAQTNPIDMYPHKPGDVIINKCYDAEGNLHATMKYTIADNYNSDIDDYLEIQFVMTDANDELIDYGTIYADYDGEDFQLKMSNRPETVNVSDYISLNTKLMNDFLDYPDPFLNEPYDQGPFRLEAADYTIKAGKRNRDFINVKVHGRDLVGEEKIKTPAGEFEASKITFALDVYNNDTRKTDTYNGTEWYSVNKGIVRTEITDKQGNMVDYSELTELREK